MNREPRLPAMLKNELAGTKWRWKRGTKHWHLMVNGRLVTIWPNGHSGTATNGFKVLNARAHIRRALGK